MNMSNLFKKTFILVTLSFTALAFSTHSFSADINMSADINNIALSGYDSFHTLKTNNR